MEMWKKAVQHIHMWILPYIFNIGNICLNVHFQNYIHFWQDLICGVVEYFGLSYFEHTNLIIQVQFKIRAKSMLYH